MINIGINGLGRIGKCVFLQLLTNKNFSIKCINVTKLGIKEIEEYLKYDSIHHYARNFMVQILSDTEFEIGEHKIKLLSDREPKNLNWRDYGCEYVFDCTGAFLTTDKCSTHNVDYVIMSAPAKDSTPTFIYGTNTDKYSGQQIVSGSSCTTNCLAPFLKLTNDKYKIIDCVFTTIHATTASQYTTDIVDKKARTSRSILNNIIPHTTGASSSVYSVLPELKGLINGTSLRVPVSNGSLLDLNIQFANNQVMLSDIIELIKSNELYKIVYDINDKNLVSCDFITTTTPTILDKSASIDMGNGKFKFFLWYDNEWSYSSQLIRLCETMYNYNISIKIPKLIDIQPNETKYYLENLDLEGKYVVLRLDLNVPIKNNVVVDDYRIQSAIPTIDTILKKNPSKLIICSHLGRPKGCDLNYTLSQIILSLNKYLQLPVEFISFGISNLAINKISNSDYKVFLLENLRFYGEETQYEKGDLGLENNSIINTYSTLGDVFILDAFGCAHRNHMSIGGIKEFELKLGKTIGYGHLIHKEITNLSSLVNKNKKILCVIGGNKVEDKLPIVKSFSNLLNAKIFVAGGLAKYYIQQMELGTQTINSNITIMKDGWGSSLMSDNPQYIPDISNTELNCWDIGPDSKAKLFKMVDKVDIVFWNGSLGVIENDFYSQSSKQFVKFLESKSNIKTIIGGGETASLVTNKDSNIYVSTGGGALLEFLELKFNSGTNLPGISIFE
jgi:glyceraldehyde 3-phosphate dehydrogenase